LWGGGRDRERVARHQSTRIATMGERAYDVVVWGATGFTGNLICQHLALHAPPTLKWVAAGRREAALKKVCAELPAGACQPSGVLVGDADDAVAAARIAKSCRLVLAAAGPFAKFSATILKACAEHGTHYVDITGEAIPYVSESVRTHDAVARKSGAKLVHCCGYDSVPSDLLTLLAIEALREHGQATTHVTVGFDLLRTVGTMSGGTLHTICAIMAYLSSTPTAIPDALNPFSLCTPQPEQQLFPTRLYELLTGADAWHLPGWSAGLQQWHFLFGMAVCNTRIVRRSRCLLEDAPSSFVYREVRALIAWCSRSHSQSRARGLSLPGAPSCCIRRRLQLDIPLPMLSPTRR
jgi:short subunit dehydrogenase-like uncharacterized protein